MLKTNYKNNSRKKITTIILIMVVLLCAFFTLEKTNTTHFFTWGHSNSKESQEDKNAKTTSSVPTAQEDYSSGDERQPGNDQSENKGSSIIKDTGGNIPSDTETNQSISSSTGEITIYTPIKDSLIKKGQTIAGTSTLPKITYRILDNVTGMIAMGDLTVINGKFSGTIDFNTSSKDGRIDVFATRPDGSEYSNVEIPIIFR